MTERSLISGAQMNIINKKPGCPGGKWNKSGSHIPFNNRIYPPGEKIN